jgi:hypothetical protein
MTTVADLDPKRDMAIIRSRVVGAFTSGEDIKPLLNTLAERHPVALADLLVGAKAPEDEQWVMAALSVVDELEQALAPVGLYGRLAALHSSTALAVLQTAAVRHPAGGWLVSMSRKVEGQSAGQTHLLACVGHPSFAQNCWSHAQAGHLPGLVEVAAQTGRAEPAAALAAHGHIEATGLAMVEALSHTPNSPVVPMVAAAWGPDLTIVLNKCLPHLRSRRVALALHSQSCGYTAFSSLLDTVIRAMVHA